MLRLKRDEGRIAFEDVLSSIFSRNIAAPILPLVVSWLLKNLIVPGENGR